MVVGTPSLSTFASGQQECVGGRVTPMRRQRCTSPRGKTAKAPTATAKRMAMLLVAHDVIYK